MTRQKYKKLNLLLDSDVSFTQQEIKEELGIHLLPKQLKAFKLFMLNFAEFRETIAFSAGNNTYPPHNFNIHDLTYTPVQNVYKKLDEAKLAKFFKGKPRGRADKAELSRLRPSKKLLNWLDEKFPYEDSIYLNPQTHVRLRNERKTILDYKPTLYTKHVDQVMKDYHQKLIHWGYSLDGIVMDKVHMYCNFNKFDYDLDGNFNIRYGGRWWAEHNQIPSKERTRRISFDNVKGGDELVEVDFTSSILTALRYWELGREPETDHYKLFRHDSYVDRQHVKNVCQLLLNRRKKGIEDAYQENFYLNAKGKSKKKLSLKQKVELHWLTDTAGRFMIKHKEIRHWFRGKRIGALASFIETNLMLEIVRRCCNENIPVLTVYDSCIVPKKHQKRVYQLMYEEDILPFVKDLIDKDEQDSVERTFKGHIDWNKPFVKQWVKEAKAKDMTLLDHSFFEGMYEYRFNACGHVRDYEPANIRTSQPKCDVCYQQQLHDEAKRAGLELIGDGTLGRHYRLYRFIECGHERELLMHHVRDGVAECQVCRFKELQNDGKANGLIVIGKSKSGGKNLWYECKFIKCGHHQDMLPQHIRGVPDQCHTCRIEKHKQEAKDAGLELIGEGRNKDYRWYKRIVCGHKLELLLQHVRNRTFVCHQCEQTAYDLPSMVYLLKLTHQDLTWLKLGHAQYLKTRIKQYGLVKGVEVEEIKTIDFDTGKEATAYENKLHKKYKSSKINKEKMKDYMQFGFDECYKPKALDKLLEELESV